WIIDSGCLKHMMGNRALLTNFVEKFLETLRFGNNDFAVIAGYRDVVIGSMMIMKVYYVEGLGHNLFSVGQFCDNGLKVAFRKSTCFVRNEDGVDLLTGKIHRKHHKSKTAFALNKPLYLLHIDLCGPIRVQSINGKRYVLVVVDDYSRSSMLEYKTLAKFFDEVGITQQFSAARTPQQNGVVERRNRTLVKAARTMLTFANQPSFL
nr:integrase, catalytic region, zinc finger, CCHC-type, peptidase aspartic, catalytic [Tanacetum cinerariifolium]